MSSAHRRDDAEKSHPKPVHPKSGPGHAAAGTAGHNPPGNNGTVFIHQVAGDAHPHNQPHVSCEFYVALFDFDSNQPLTASFAGQAPTGAGVPVDIEGQPTLSTTAPDNGATGAGHGYDGDFASLAFTDSNLDLSGLGAPAKQGYHLRLTIGTGQGGGRKTKVFWFTPCSSQSSTGGSTSSTIKHTGSRATTASARSGSAATGRSERATAASRGAGTTRVLGMHLRRSAGLAAGTGTATAATSRTSAAGATATAASALPFTGADIAGMTAAAGLALAGGAGLLRLGRRRKTQTIRG